MKSRVLSFVIALIALFAFNNAFAQKANPKISNPDKDDVRISGAYSQDRSTYTICIDFARITGLGNATAVDASLTVAGSADVLCYNNGQQKQDSPKFIPGQTFSTTGGAVSLTPNNGVLIITSNDHVCVTIGGTCSPNGFNWKSEVSNINITNMYLTLNGKQVSLNDYIYQLSF